MERILALDTSTWWAGVALLERSHAAELPRVVAELGVQVAESHAPHMLGWIEHLLVVAAWDRAQLDGYVATHGPGSFTGIRVGLGTLRGLALATGRPCVGVTTLDALAEAHGPAEADRVALIGAGRGELYGARYTARSSPVRIVDAPRLDQGERLCGLLAATDAVCIPAPGSEPLIRRLSPPAVRVATAPRSIAAAAGRLALLRDDLRSERANRLAPLYLRPPDVRPPRHRTD